MITLRSVGKVELGRSLAALREAKGLSRATVAQAAGVTANMLREYERGGRMPRKRNLVRILDALCCSLSELEDMIAYLRQGAPDVRSQEQPSEQAVRGVTRSLEYLAEAQLSGPTEPVEAAAPADRIQRAVVRARELLLMCSGEDWLEIVEEVKALQSPAFCEVLCTQSVATGREDVQRAIQLAKLAVSVAEIIPGDRNLRSQVAGYCLAFLANAYRVASDFAAARVAFSQSDTLWGEDAPGASHGLDSTRLLDLRASFLRDQRQIPESLSLLDRALAIGPRTTAARARLLIKKARAYEEVKDYEASVASLREAAPLLDAEPDPILVLVHRFNLLENLYQLGRVDEAEPLIPEVQDLVARLGNDLDRLRLHWLEGRILALRGREDEAATVLRRVRADFQKRKIAFDVALVTLELAELLLRQGQTGEVKELAEETLKIFGEQGIKPEAEKALRLFCEAALKEAATVELVRRVLAEVEAAGRG